MAEIPENWIECERGNSWFLTEDGSDQLLFFRLPDDRMIEVSIYPENYPGAHISLLSASEFKSGKPTQTLLDHIHENCDGWVVRKCNLEGVNIEDGYITVPETKKTYSP